MILRSGRLVLLASLGAVGGCMVQQPLGYNQPPYYGPAPYDQASYGMPPRGAGAPLVLAPSSLPDSRAAPVPPPIAVEPLLPPPGSNTEDTFVPRSVPDDSATAGNPNLPSSDDDGVPSYPQDTATGAGASPIAPGRAGGQSAPPPIVGSADAAAQPAPDAATPGSSDQSIQQQLAAIKQNLVQQAPPSAPEANPPIIEVHPDHTRYGGLSSSGDVGTH